MNNLVIETQTLNRIKRTDDRSTHDHDIREIAVGFGQHFGSRLKKLRFWHNDSRVKSLFGASIPYGIRFRLPIARLQTRLESLCESLRAKY